jgi:quercetin dioxygenase-like cupin family protein
MELNDDGIVLGGASSGSTTFRDREVHQNGEANMDQENIEGLKHGSETRLLLSTSVAWDDSPYTAYSEGTPELSVVLLNLPARRELFWHKHAMPNAAYIISGSLTIEKRDGTKRFFTAGQAMAEFLHSVHRGIVGEEPTVIVVFYAGVKGMPLSERG